MKKKNGTQLMFNFPLTKSSQQGKTASERQDPAIDGASETMDRGPKRGR